ncbi:hypothetical protein B0H19DRAFT_1260384 [Mycena capillaripes]|nr:hypothetical protein B0H19DRAFT_1260384 [Mycena capillaripes]
MAVCITSQRLTYGSRYQSSALTLIITYTCIRGLFAAAALRMAHQMNLHRVVIALSALLPSPHLIRLLAEVVPKLHAKNRIHILVPATLTPLHREYWLKVVLTIDDCGTLPNELGVKSTRELLYAAILRHSAPKKLNLILALLRAFTLAFVSPVFPRLLLLAATIFQPLLVPSMIPNISDHQPIDAKGWTLVGAFACVCGVIALMTSIY